MAWFDATQYDPTNMVPQWPLGKWPVIIIDSDKVGVKDKPNSGMLVFTLKILDGPHKDFVGQYRLNIWNESPQAKEIAHKQLAAVCSVTASWKLNDTVKMGSELFGKPFFIAVVSQDDPKYTQIAGVFDVAGNPPVKWQGQPQPQQPGPQAGAGPGSMPPTGPQPGWQQPPTAAPNPAQPQPQPQPNWGTPAPTAPATPAAQTPTPQPSWAQNPAPAATPSWQR